MSRRHAAEKREVLPDPKFGDVVLNKFTNSLMLKGKKSVAERIVYDAFDIMEKKTGQDPLKLFHEAIDNVRPAVEVRSRRVGGATYQVPIEVRHDRRQALAIRWIVELARKRSENTMTERLSVIQRIFGLYPVGLADCHDDASKWLGNDEAVPGIHVPGTIGCARDRHKRHTGDPSHQNGSCFDLELGPAWPIDRGHNRIAIFHHLLLVAQRKGPALVGRATYHLGSPRAHNSPRHLAVDGTRYEKTHLVTTFDPLTHIGGTQNVILVPVARRGHGAALDQRQYVLFADYRLVPVGGRQQTKEATGNRQAKKIQQATRRGHSSA